MAAPRRTASARWARHGFGAIAPQGQTDVADRAVVHGEHGGRPKPAAKANEARSRTLRYADPAPGQRRWHLDRRDQRAAVEHRVAARVVARAGGRDRRSASAARPPCSDHDGRVERGEGDGHVRGWVAMHASEPPSTARLRWSPVRRRASRARLPLVARLGDVLEVGAPGALQQVPADRRHVPQLTGGPGEQRLCQQRVASADSPGRRRGRCCGTAAPMRSRRRPARRRWPSGSPLTSTSIVGRATPSFIRSTRFVPPARNTAPGVDATAPRPRRDRRPGVGERPHRRPPSARAPPATMLT